MNFAKRRLGWLFFSSFLLAACGESPHLVFEVQELDSGAPGSDAALLDSGAIDAESEDAGAPDAALVDAALVDGAVADAAVVDGAVADAALVDAALDSAVTPDASMDAAIVDAAVDASAVDCIARDSAELTAKLLDVRCDSIDLVANTFRGNFVAARRVSLVGTGRETTILEGTDASRNAVLEVASTTGIVEVVNMRVTGGVSGGISASSRIALSNVELDGNHGPSGGGGLYATSDVSIVNAFIHDNTTGVAGAGVGVLGTGTQTVYIANTVVKNNAVSTGEQGGGGGLVVFQAASVEIENSTFDGNSVVGRSTDEEGTINGGGAIFANVGVVDVTGSSFSGNSVSTEVGGGGAGFSLSGCPDATFEDIVVDSNVVDSHGETPAGARIGNSNVTIRRASFRGNKILQDWARSSPATRFSVRGAGLATSNSEFLLDRVVAENNVIELIDPPADITVHGAGAAFQAWSGDSRGTVRNSAFVGNSVDVTLSAGVPTFTGNNISGIGVWVVGDEDFNNSVHFVNTTIGENECDLSDPISTEIALDALDQSNFTVYFANATIVGYLDRTAISSSIAPGPVVPSRVEFANTIVDHFVSPSPAVCALHAMTTAVSRGYNLVPMSCVLPAGWQASDTAITSVIHAGLASRLATPIPHYPLSFPNLAQDGGDPLGCTEGDGTPIEDDALGSPRTGICDVGAVEAELIP